MTIVYLSGGIDTTWRDEVKAYFENNKSIEFISPMDNFTTYASVYSARNMNSINDSDIVLAFMAANNPSGVGLAFEVGYALGLGKHVIFLDPTKNFKMDYVAHAASVYVTDYDEAMALLEYASEVL